MFQARQKKVLAQLAICNRNTTAITKSVARMEVKANCEETSFTYFKLCEGDILKLHYEETDLAFMQCLKAFTGAAISSHFRISSNACFYMFSSQVRPSACNCCNN